MGVARDALGNFGSIISFGPHSLQSPWRIGVSKIVLGIHMEIEGDREGTLGIGVFFFIALGICYIFLYLLYMYLEDITDSLLDIQHAFLGVHVALSWYYNS
jgi:hypothetical protein